MGSDSGLLARPASHTALTVAPGERFDVVVDFSAYPVGTEATLLNTLETGATGQIMRFRVARRGRDDSAVPDQLTSIELLNPDDATQVRTFDFRTINQDGRHMWTVNGQLFDLSASVAQPQFGTVERWRFSSDFHHPIHLHLVHFQVLSRNGRPPQPSDGGWKDTVDVRLYEVVEVLAHFDGFCGRYMMHCHNLEHEDMAMMANFDVV